MSPKNRVGTRIVLAALVAVIVLMLVWALVQFVVLPLLPAAWQNYLVLVVLALLGTVGLLSGFAQLTGYSLKDVVGTSPKGGAQQEPPGSPANVETQDGEPLADPVSEPNRPQPAARMRPRSRRLWSDTDTLPYPSLLLSTCSVPSPVSDFSGREDLIRDLIADELPRLVCVVGIPGIGKTALMREIASQLEQAGVFWYEFRAGLISTDDFLACLSGYLGRQHQSSRPRHNGAHAVSRSEEVAFILRELNSGPHFLFFDSVQNAEGYQDLIGFLSLLKDHLHVGRLYVSSRSRPSFLSSLDEANQVVKTVQLEGLIASEVQNLFDKNGIEPSETIREALEVRFGGLPLALRLSMPLLRARPDPVEFLSILNTIEEHTIEHLFREVYDRLGPDEQSLLTLASLLHVPFSRDNICGAYRALFRREGVSRTFISLKQSLLLSETAESQYEVHEAIRTMTLAYADNLNAWRIEFAEYLAANMPEDLDSQLEAVLLFGSAGAFERAAELAVPLIDTCLVPYYPDLAATILDNLREDMVSPEQQLWLMGSKGVLAHFWRQTDVAERHYQKMLSVAVQLQDKPGAATALQRLGNLYLGRNPDIARRYYLDSMTLKKELDDVTGQAQILNNQGSLYVGIGRFEDARSVLEEGVRLLETDSAPEWQKLSLYGNLAQLNGEQKRWDDATRFSELAREIAEETGALYEVANLTADIGVHEERQGHQGAARERFQEALALATTYGLWEIEERALIGLGKQQYELGEYRAAIASFDRVAEIEEQVHDEVRLASTYFDLGTFYWHDNDQQTAMALYEKGIDRFERLESDEKIRLFLHNIYRLASASMDPRRMANALKRLKNRLQVTSPSYALAEVYGTLGDIYHQLLKLDRVALACKRKEIELLAHLGRDTEQAEALIDLGALCQDLEQYGPALDAATAAIKVAEATNQTRLRAIAGYNRGNCYADLEMWSQAENDYQGALETARLSEDPQLLDGIQHNLGEIYRRRGQPELAVPLLSMSLAAARERGDVDDEIRGLNNLGLAYHQMEDNDKALECFSMALDAARRSFRKHDEANILISLGNHYAERDRPDEARVHFSDALAVARAAEDIDMEEGAVLSLAYAHRRLGTFDDIADDFRLMAERASQLKHYSVLVQYLTLGGEMNMEESEPVAAADMFHQALLTALVLGADRIEQFKLHEEKPQLLPELIDVMAGLCSSIEEAVHKGEGALARDLSEEVATRIRGEGESCAWLADYLMPIDAYLRKPPDRRLLEFLVEAWNDEEQGFDG